MVDAEASKFRGGVFVWALCSDGGAAVFFAYGIAPPVDGGADRPRAQRASYGHPTDKEPGTTDKEPDKELGILRTSYGQRTGHDRA
jgi:hypothetical protein